MKTNTTRRDAPMPPKQKLQWKPGAMLMPLPVVMVTTLDANEKANIVTVAWTGMACSNPPILSLSLRPSRYSYEAVRDRKEVVVNIPSVAQARMTDKCGVLSGRDTDKFAVTGLTPGPARKVAPPIIMECPLNLECRVRKSLELGSHTLFLAEVVAVQVSPELVTKGGRLAMEKAGLIAFAHGHYYALGRYLGHFGYSVRRKK